MCTVVVVEPNVQDVVFKGSNPVATSYDRATTCSNLVISPYLPPENTGWCVVVDATSNRLIGSAMARDRVCPRLVPLDNSGTRIANIVVHKVSVIPIIFSADYGIY